MTGRLASDPRVDRSSDLTAVVISAPGDRPEPTPGSAHDRLPACLDARLEATDGVDVRVPGSVAPSPGTGVPDGARAASPR
ncbi:hypothetical protein [Streptomyces sp. NPDC102283]|uniref:hypothetical protein n=1 Tax=Streptomyces sp. NPDC102283 TaxID=3366155 RepID=UPI003829AA3D